MLLVACHALWHLYLYLHNCSTDCD
jgi:hypothetical protein